MTTKKKTEKKARPRVAVGPRPRREGEGTQPPTRDRVGVKHGDEARKAGKLPALEG